MRAFHLTALALLAGVAACPDDTAHQCYPLDETVVDPADPPAPSEFPFCEWTSPSDAEELYGPYVVTICEASSGGDCDACAVSEIDQQLRDEGVALFEGVEHAQHACVPSVDYFLRGCYRFTEATDTCCYYASVWSATCIPNVGD